MYIYYFSECQSYRRELKWQQNCGPIPERKHIKWTNFPSGKSATPIYIYISLFRLPNGTLTKCQSGLGASLVRYCHQNWLFNTIKMS